MKNTTSRQIPKQQIAHQLEYIEQVSRRNALLPEQQWFFCQTFGCQQNEADTERIAGMLRDMGYQRTEDYTKANMIVVNTCAVREHAEKRVFGMMGKYTHLKDSRDDLVICMCGCMVQQEHITEKIKKSYPRVDIVFGTHMQWRFPELLLHRLSGSKRIFEISGDPKGEIAEGLPVQRGEGCHAWLSIMYGCNNFCTYCIVPYVRGRERSRDPEQILKEVRQLVADDYKEIMLLGQNVNSYGKDLETPLSFAQLLRKVSEIPGEFIVRFMSSHPKDATPELLDTILECPKVGHHLHLPVQSGSNDVLRRMNRRYTVEKYLESVSYLRRRDPDFSLTTDLIVGFPNETEAEFQDTLNLIRQVQYDNIYTFIYSKRRGTKAAEMEDCTTDAEKRDRMERLLTLQRDIASEHNRRFIGRTLRVLVDGESKRKGNLVGKDSAFIIVEFPGDKSLIGTFQNVRITEARNWAVLGELAEEEQK